VLPEFSLPWPPRLNPHVDSARAHSKAWAREMGMLTGRGMWDEDTFDSDDWPLFAALTHPDATESQLHRISLWDVCLLALDDYFVAAYKATHDLAGAKAFVEGLRAFMPEPGSAAPAPANPVERGLADVWGRTAPAMPAPVRDRFPDHVMEFARGNVWELVNNIQNRIPDPLGYSEMRRETSGTELSTNLTVHTGDRELSPEILRTRPMQTLISTFADTVGIRNDIYSYRKEIEREHDVNNGVLAIRNFLGCGLQQAVDVAYDLFTARLRQFEHTATIELPALAEDMGLDAGTRSGIVRYVARLRDWMAGDNQWYRMTGRYRGNLATSPGRR
jgi:germacradienol/geosmin synthase